MNCVPRPTTSAASRAGADKEPATWACCREIEEAKPDELLVDVCCCRLDTCAAVGAAGWTYWPVILRTTRRRWTQTQDHPGGSLTAPAPGGPSGESRLRQVLQSLQMPWHPEAPASPCESAPSRRYLLLEVADDGPGVVRRMRCGCSSGSIAPTRARRGLGVVDRRLFGGGPRGLDHRDDRAPGGLLLSCLAAARQ